MSARFNGVEYTISQVKDVNELGQVYILSSDKHGGICAFGRGDTDAIAMLNCHNYLLEYIEHSVSIFKGIIV